MDSQGRKQFIVKGTNHNMNVPIHDPHEKFNHVNFKVFGSECTTIAPTQPTMGNFYQDFASYDDQPQQIMESSYTPTELPVLNGLAKNFAVSDEYFCSIPTQTNSNRAFSVSGNSIGLNKAHQSKAWVNNRNTDYIPPHLSQLKGNQFNQKTIWNVLSENGFDSTSDWMQYHSNGNWIEDILGLEGYSYTRELMQKIQGPSLLLFLTINKHDNSRKAPFPSCHVCY